MSFLIADLGAFALATLGAVLLLLVPGFGLRALLVRAGVLDQQCSIWWAWVLGIAVLPAIDALAIRWVGMAATIALHGALALSGAPDAWRSVRRMPVRGWAAALFWWLLVAWALADFGDARGLNQSLIVLDMVKHAAVVSAISGHGLPLIDPFFLRDGPAGYYHFFYTGPALIDWILPGVDARGAMLAATWSAGIAFVAMANLVAQAAGLSTGRGARYAVILAVLMLVSGLDLLPMALVWLRHGVVLGQLDWWAQEVRWGAISLLWVPHHLSALSAALVACLLIAHPARAAATRIAASSAAGIAAGIALASAFGMSVWVTLAMAPAIALWWLVGVARGSRSFALPAAGLVALIVAAPQFVDLWQGRAAAPFPLAFALRDFGAGLPTAPWQDALLLPLSLAIEYGLFAYGSWRWLARRDNRTQNDMARLLPIMAVVGLSLACLVQSVLINNDFGWRAMWLAQLPAMLWTAAWLSKERARWRMPAVLALGGLGIAAAAVDLAGLRLIRPPAVRSTLEYINAHPAIDAELRAAYHWMNRALPPGAIVQHDPARDERSFAFGLYGRHRPLVADEQAQLFGAAERDVRARIAAVAPLFDGSLGPGTIDARAAALGIDALLITSRDGAWPVPAGRCAYRTRHVCVLRVRRGR